MTPYYQDASVTLYHGDCLQILRTLDGAIVDGVLMDPPYCSGGSLEAQKNTGGEGHTSKRIASEDFEWFAADNMSTGGLVWLIRAVLVECRRIMVPNRSALVFTDWRMVPHLAPALESSGLRYRNLIVWDKGSAGLGRGFRPAHECLLEYSNGATEYVSKAGQNVIRTRRVAPADRVHACQKPVDLLRDVMEVITAPGGLILDPFAGSASTLVAAKQCGRRAIGIELSEENCARAAARLQQEFALA